MADISLNNSQTYNEEEVEMKNQYTEEEEISQNLNQKNFHLDLQLFSYKILDAKHNSTPEL